MNRATVGVSEHTRKGRPGIWYTAKIEKDKKSYSNTFRYREKAECWRKQKEEELFGEYRRASL